MKSKISIVRFLARCSLPLLMVFSVSLCCSAQGVDLGGTHKLIHTYRQMLVLAVVSGRSGIIQMESSRIDELTKDLADSRVSGGQLFDKAISLNYVNDYLVKLGVACTASDEKIKKVWLNKFDEKQKLEMIAIYLSTYGIEGLQNPAVDGYFKLSASQKEKLSKTIDNMVKFDRSNISSLAGDAPRNLFTMQFRLGYAREVLDRNQFRLLEELVNEPDRKTVVRFTLGF